MSNTLQNQGHANRRPAVCRKPPPSDCPFGELILETISLTFELHWIWNLRGTWSLVPIDSFVIGRMDATVNRGRIDANNFDVDTVNPFGITIDSDPGPFICILFVQVTTPQGCQYAAVASIEIPANPQ